jgi:hypothetical protein
MAKVNRGSNEEGMTLQPGSHPVGLAKEESHGLGLGNGRMLVAGDRLTTPVRLSTRTFPFYGVRDETPQSPVTPQRLKAM